MGQKNKSIFDTYKRDLDAEEQGEWVLFAGGIEMKIRALSSSHYRDVSTRLTSPYSRGKSGSGILDLPEAIQRSVVTKAVVNGLIVDWRNVFDEKGKAIPFSSEKAYDILKDKSMSDLVDDILEAAGYRETFIRERNEETEKNSSKTSTG